MAFDVRGVVEGFYGPPWAPEEREAAIEWLGSVGANAYVYAPKDDPLHRSRWREAYDAETAAHLGAVARAGAASGVRCGFALSPGLDVDVEADADVDRLRAKVGAAVELGFDWIVLALDDIPTRPDLARVHVALVTAVSELVGPAVHLTFVPTEYVGTRPTAYLATIGAELPDDVDVMWTGPTVCSPTVDAAAARAWLDAVAGRPTLLWDNYPVNDATMTDELHLGPYQGRDPALAGVLRGVLCNPMNQPRASRIALHTAMQFLRSPERYEPGAAWDAALADSPAGTAPLARACATSALAGGAALPLGRELDRLEAALDRAGGAGASAEPRARLRAELDAARSIAIADPALAGEVAPWVEQAAREAAAGLAALQLLELAGDAATDAEAAMFQVFAVLFTWSAARRGAPVAYGPRFTVYPAVVQLPDGRPAVDLDLAVREGENQIDRLCRRALAEYARWCAEAR